MDINSCYRRKEDEDPAGSHETFSEFGIGKFPKLSVLTKMGKFPVLLLLVAIENSLMVVN